MESELIKFYIKEVADTLYLKECYRKIDAPYKYDKKHIADIIKKLTSLVQIENPEIFQRDDDPTATECMKLQIHKISTTGEQTETRSYYPKKSFYRVGISYSGQGAQFYFYSCTLHFTKEMEFISRQFHVDDMGKRPLKVKIVGL